MTKRTGVFFHYQQGERLRDFPQALAGILQCDNVFMYDAYYPLKPPSSFELSPLSKDMLSHVHTLEMVNEIANSPAFLGAVFSASGTVAAAIRICLGEVDNAFVFTGYGDHHAGTHFWGGGCYFNGAAIAIREMRAEFAVKRVAIVDTDPHHGDGTWEIFKDDPDTLYVCFCTGDTYERNNKINVRVPCRTSDGEYMTLVKENFIARAEAFRPEILFWNWGYDGTSGEYGDIGITPTTHILLARLLKKTADAVCQGKLVTVLCGGSQRYLARRLIPTIVSILAEQEQSV
ncbi:MAG: hypothetical protein NTU41_13160 [Chloroflexi bacterium]|nr:hypothetical protein [Chloroflexota bacterium]